MGHSEKKDISNKTKTKLHLSPRQNAKNMNFSNFLFSNMGPFNRDFTAIFPWRHDWMAPIGQIEKFSRISRIYSIIITKRKEKKNIWIYIRNISKWHIWCFFVLFLFFVLGHESLWCFSFYKRSLAIVILLFQKS